MDSQIKHAVVVKIMGRTGVINQECFVMN
ncbi:hypothetical protein OIU77_013121 [Salix suchowensis]|uniref:Uncharacterized protein n=1 Tax=Salix suchowensis TaxID=1278906 RepID=A0ABQ8ZT15_9ROSI|nr:hypothetical protein OIU77_013121 [Salix suchowensis]